MALRLDAFIVKDTSTGNTRVICRECTIGKYGFIVIGPVPPSLPERSYKAICSDCRCVLPEMEV